jgi:predicted dehydrogenase
MNRTLTVGVIGCGYWGPNLVRNFRSLPDCCMSVVCDRDRKRLKHVQSLYPDMKVETSLDDMLAAESLDAVAIATPVSLHHKQTMAVLRAGKHVFIEKPMATSSADCDEMFTLAREKGLTLMVGHTFL